MEVQYYGRDRQFEVLSITGSGNLFLPESSNHTPCERDLLERFKGMKMENEQESGTLQGLGVEQCENKGDKTLTEIQSKHEHLSVTNHVCSNCSTMSTTSKSTCSICSNNDKIEYCAAFRSNPCQTQFYQISSIMTKFIIIPYGTAKNQKTKINANVTFASIGGLSRQIQLVREAIEMSFKHPELFRTYGKSFYIYCLRTNY